MKRIYVALFLIGISLLFSFAEYYTVDKSFKYYSKKLDESKIYFSDKKYKDAYFLLSDVEKEWENTAKKFKIFLSHDKANAISQNIENLKEFADKKEDTDFYVELNKTKRQLLCIKQSELPKFENIL